MSGKLPDCEFEALPNFKFKRGTKVVVTKVYQYGVKYCQQHIQDCANSDDPRARALEKNAQQTIDLLRNSVGKTGVVDDYIYGYNPHIVKLQDGTTVCLPGYCLSAV